MKTINILILGITLLGAQAFASLGDGTDAGNGGDEYAKQFITLGTDIAESLAQNPLPEVTATELMNAIRATKVNSNDQLTLNGNEVDAINYPGDAPRVLVSRMGWDRMAREPHRRAFLVLHEYLGIMGKDDSRYQISMMLDRAGVCGRTPGIRRFIERYLHKSCYRIINDDLQYVERIDIMDPNFTTFSKEDLTGLSGLNAIGIYDTAMESIDPHSFDLVADSLTHLTLGASFLDWNDCGFLSNLQNLESINVGWSNSNLGGDLTYVRKLAPNCFSKNKKINWIRLSLNFNSGFSSQGFLKGLGDHHKLSSVNIQGYGLEKIPPIEYSQIPKNTKLNILNDKNTFTANYVTQLNQVMGRNYCVLIGEAPTNSIDCVK